MELICIVRVMDLSKSVITLKLVKHSCCVCACAYGPVKTKKDSVDIIYDIPETLSLALALYYNCCCLFANIRNCLKQVCSYLIAQACVKHTKPVRSAISTGPGVGLIFIPTIFHQWG